MFPTSPGNCVSCTPAVCMEQGNRVELYVRVVCLQGPHHTCCMQEEVAVREHHTLGFGSGAAGVEELGNAVFVINPVGRSLKASMLQMLFVVAIAHPWLRSRRVEPNTQDFVL